MKFKVGDKVRLTRELTKADLAEVEIKFSADQVIKELGCNVFEVKDISEKNLRICISLPSDNWLLKSEWFELAEQPKQPEPQVGDVWASEDKSKVVTVLGKFERNGIDFVSYFGLKGEWKAVANFARKQTFLYKFPILLQRKPKKQPKAAKNQPKKQKEGVWEPVWSPEGGMCKTLRCGNKIKVIYDGCEGLAVCNKKDKFDLMFGVNLASFRALVKHHEAEIAEMIKTGVK